MPDEFLRHVRRLVLLAVVATALLVGLLAASILYR